MRRAHPEAYNLVKSAAAEGTKKWTEEERRSLAMAEAQLLAAGELATQSTVHQRHAQEFPLRTVDAIKGARQRKDHKSMVQTYLGKLQAAVSTADGGACADVGGNNTNAEGGLFCGVPVSLFELKTHLQHLIALR